MRQSNRRHWTVVIVLLAPGALNTVRAEELNFWQRSSGGAQVLDATNNTNWAANQTPPQGTNMPIGPPAKPNIFQRTASAVGSAASSVSRGVKGAFKPKEKSTVSGSTKTTFRRPQKPLDADFHVTLAAVQEQSGDFAGAEEQYQRALKLDPNSLPAMLGYGRLHDRQQHYTEALSWYTKATKKHPRQAAAWNDLGLCYSRMNKLSEAIGAMEKAAALDPTRKLYRNNLAAVLVKVNRSDEAFKQLAAVHPEAVARYNVGYLLAQQNERQLAYRYFSEALEADPNLQEARQWRDLLVPTVATLPPPPGQQGSTRAHEQQRVDGPPASRQPPRFDRSQRPNQDRAPIQDVSQLAESRVPAATSLPRRNQYSPRGPSTPVDKAVDDIRPSADALPVEHSREPADPPLPAGIEEDSRPLGADDSLAGPRPDTIGAPSGASSRSPREAHKRARVSAPWAPSRY